MSAHNNDIWDFSDLIKNKEKENEELPKPEKSTEEAKGTESEEKKEKPNIPEVEKNSEEVVVPETEITNVEKNDEPTVTEAESFSQKSAETDDSSSDNTTSDDNSSQNSTSLFPEEDVDDYVYARYRRSHSSGHHHHHSHHYGKDHSGSEKVVASTSDTHYRDKKGRRNKRKKVRPWWKKLLIILAWIIGVILALGLCLFIFITVSCNCGLKALTDYQYMDMNAPVIDGVEVSDKGKRVTYKGVEYEFNSDMTSILCMGVDRHSLDPVTTENAGKGGQADALYMIALDTDTGETKIIAIPRDTVTDIGVYSATGEYLRTEKHQICLAYAYGDGRKTSCTNTVTAVSRLFYQLPINTYFAININSIADLNDAVGGVTVTMTDNSFYDIYQVQHFKGEKLTLYGDNARKYVQHREVSQLESTTDRMGRQINYLEAFTSKALSMTKKDLSTPVSLYNIVSDNSETNLTTSTITAFASCIVTNGISGVDFVKVPGKLTSNGTYAEYIVDEEALYEMILDIYYTPVTE